MDRMTISIRTQEGSNQHEEDIEVNLEQLRLGHFYLEDMLHTVREKILEALHRLGY